MRNVRLESKIIGDNNPCYFVAEIGGLFKNFNEAKRLIDSAIEVGIDAIKFQTLEAETITTKNNFFNLGVTGHVSQYEFFKKFEPSKELQMEVVKYAKDVGITIFSAPSHMKDLDLMKKMNLSIYKIGSDLACHIPLLKEVANLNKPIILSTGMCTLEEVRDSVNTILDTGNEQIILLHCVSDYPAKKEESNLKAIQTMKDEFGLPVGYSDHTIGIEIPFTAAIIGANLVEKHFRHLDNSSTADDVHAIIPSQFRQLIQNVRDVEKVLGNGKKIPTFSEQKNLMENRVSVVSLIDISAGTTITKEMIDVRRPGTGLAPKYFEKIIGKSTKIDIKSETPIRWEFLT